MTDKINKKAMRKILILSAFSAVCFVFLGGAAFGQNSPAKEVSPPTSLTEFEGRYEFNPTRIQNFIIDLTADGGSSLKMKLSHRQERTFNLENKNQFADSEFTKIKLVFIRDKDDKITGLELQNFRLNFYSDNRDNIFSQLQSGNLNINAKKLELPPPSVSGNTEFKIKGFPNARIVALAGSFNNWNQSKNLCVWENDSWTCRIDLTAGRYTYKFIVDGAWMVDPANKETEADEYGNRNSVINVAAENK